MLAGRSWSARAAAWFSIFRENAFWKTPYRTPPEDPHPYRTYRLVGGSALDSLLVLWKPSGAVRRISSSRASWDRPPPGKAGRRSRSRDAVAEPCCYGGEAAGQGALGDQLRWGLSATGWGVTLLQEHSPQAPASSLEQGE